MGQWLRRFVSRGLATHPLVTVLDERGNVAEFDTEAINAANVRFAAFFVSFGVILFSPTDRWVYPAEWWDTLLVWRYGLFVMSVATLVVFRRRPDTRRDWPSPLWPLGGGAAFSAACFGLMAGSRPLYEVVSYMAPWLIMAWFGPAVSRLKATLILGACWVGGGLTSIPIAALLDLPTPNWELPRMLAHYTTAVLFAFGTSHIVTTIARMYSLQRQKLARLNNELALLNDELESRVLARSAELRQLAEHLDRLLENERRRIARDLHDDLSMSLTLVKMELVTLLNDESPQEPERLRAVLARQRDTLDGAFASLRRILAQLRPQILDDLGLIAAAEWLFRDFRTRHGIAGELLVEPEDFEVDPPRAEAMFRILQECLTNVARHAEASRVRVNLRCQGDKVNLEVGDNGVGLGNSQQAGSGLGLIAMRERCRQFGGDLEVDTPAGGGTRVRATLPSPEIES